MVLLSFWELNFQFLLFALIKMIDSNEAPMETVHVLVPPAWSSDFLRSISLSLVFPKKKTDVNLPGCINLHRLSCDYLLRSFLSSHYQPFSNRFHIQSCISKYYQDIDINEAITRINRLSVEKNWNWIQMVTPVIQMHIRVFKMSLGNFICPKQRHVISHCELALLYIYIFEIAFIHRRP